MSEVSHYCAVEISWKAFCSFNKLWCSLQYKLHRLSRSLKREASKEHNLYCLPVQCCISVIVRKIFNSTVWRHAKINASSIWIIDMFNVACDFHYIWRCRLQRRSLTICTVLWWLLEVSWSIRSTILSITNYFPPSWHLCCRWLKHSWTIERADSARLLVY